VENLGNLSKINSSLIAEQGLKCRMHTFNHYTKLALYEEGFFFFSTEYRHLNVFTQELVFKIR